MNGMLKAMNHPDGLNAPNLPAGLSGPVAPNELYDLNGLIVHIFWVLRKMTFKGWEDIRQNKSRHSFYWVHEGEGTFRTTESFRVRKGTLAYLPPGLEMSMRSSDESPLVMTMVYFDCSSCGYEDGRWSPAPLEKLDLPFLQPFEGDRALRMDQLFEALCRDWIPTRPGGELPSKGHLLAILEYGHRKASPDRSPDSGMQKLQAIKAELEEHFSEGLHIRELARKHAVSPSYLRKMFARCCGMGPKAYLERIRNEHAIRYLSYSDIPLKSIAEACGYNDEFQFSKSFKKMNGCAPSVFRANMRKSDRPV
ncbi:AraC family transcriptional regulator [Paenibacillus hamazuiensis]|uniref:AraC family transcriptional regulator n=1 Tax=Paenibacillus hamazuiensis TaxID=2936508 RepID=UPI00200F1C67|nr:AraC family transcriptional regulator [Paenibacillus hamazuiensis]